MVPGFLRRAFYRSAAREPLLRLARRALMRRRVLALAYHEVLEDHCAIEAWTVVRREDFVRQMEYVRRTFNVVTLEEAAEALRKNTKAAMAVVTFDDGYAGNLHVALPVVESLGIPITVFVATGAVMSRALYWYDRVILTLQSPRGSAVDLRPFGLQNYQLPASVDVSQRWTAIQQILTDLKGLPPDRRVDAVTSIERPGVGTSGQLRPLSVDELRRLSASKNVTIGSHSHCHNRLCQLSPEALDVTLSTSKQLLENWTGRPVRTFAYPNGDYDDGIAAAVRRHGFSLAVTTHQRPWSRSDPSLAIPRVGIGRYDGWDRFRAIASGILV